MNKLTKPPILQRDIYSAFNNLRYREILEENSAKYEQYLNNPEVLYDFEEKKAKEDSEYKEYLNKMYSERFSQKSYKNLYKFYLSIRETAKFCPYCNFPSHSVRQVDHFLPKSSFPSLSLTIDNMVPICSDCNKNKLDYFALKKEDLLLHPYFDSILECAYNFITCKIIEKDTIGFVFSIKKLEDWDDNTYKRVKIHFSKLQLDTLYSTDFETEFSVYMEELKDLYNDCGIDDVKYNLQRKINSYFKAKIKPWCYVGYTALLNNKWFFEYYIKMFRIVYING